MPPVNEIDVPAGYVPQVAMAFGADGVAATPVDVGTPMPVNLSYGVARSTPLAGSTAVSGLIGPLMPDLGRPIRILLSGTWSGTVTLQRSTDNGLTRQPLTAGGSAWAQFTANASEPVAEESVVGATYYLDVQLASGTLTYRLEQ